MKRPNIDLVRRLAMEPPTPTAIIRKRAFWPPRSVRRNLPRAGRSLRTRRARKAHARIVREAARYGVVVTRR